MNLVASSNCNVWIFALLGFGLGSASSFAADNGSQPSKEIYAGADASSNAWLVYSGATVAPFGGIWENGWRLRASGGYGQYRYEGLRKLVFDEDGDPEAIKRSFRAVTYYGEALVGYLHQWGPLTAKAFAGISLIGHNVTPFDVEITGNVVRSVQGVEYGPKGIVELWLNVGDFAWASVDIGHTSAHTTTSARTRLGYRFQPNLSAGPEAIFDMTSDDRNGRAGVFLRYEWTGGELSASAGVGGEWSSDFEMPTSPYGTVNWITHF